MRLQTDWSKYMQISPLSTLESSFEALNLKKFDGESNPILYMVPVCDLDEVLKKFLWFLSCICSRPPLSSNICTVWWRWSQRPFVEQSWSVWWLSGAFWFLWNTRELYVMCNSTWQIRYNRSFFCKRWVAFVNILISLVLSCT